MPLSSAKFESLLAYKSHGWTKQRLQSSAKGLLALGTRTAAHPNALLSAIVGTMQPGADLAGKLRVPYFKSIAELLMSPDRADGAIICTPNHTHVAVGLELTRGGVIFW
jgi:predicted dehydrogenase